MSKDSRANSGPRRVNYTDDAGWLDDGAATAGQRSALPAVDYLVESIQDAFLVPPPESESSLVDAIPELALSGVLRRHVAQPLDGAFASGLARYLVESINEPGKRMPKNTIPRSTPHAGSVEKGVSKQIRNNVDQLRLLAFLRLAHHDTEAAGRVYEHFCLNDRRWAMSWAQQLHFALLGLGDDEPAIREGVGLAVSGRLEDETAFALGQLGADEGNHSRVYPLLYDQMLVQLACLPVDQQTVFKSVEPVETAVMNIHASETAAGVLRQGLFARGVELRSEELARPVWDKVQGIILEYPDDEYSKQRAAYLRLFATNEMNDSAVAVAVHDPLGLLAATTDAQWVSMAKKAGGAGTVSHYGVDYKNLVAFKKWATPFVIALHNAGADMPRIPLGALRRMARTAESLTSTVDDHVLDQVNGLLKRAVNKVESREQKATKPPIG